VGHRQKIGKIKFGNFEGGGGKEKSSPPIFSPLGDPGGPKFLRRRGLSAIYLNSEFDVPVLTIGVRVWSLPVSKNFH